MQVINMQCFQIYTVLMHNSEFFISVYFYYISCNVSELNLSIQCFDTVELARKN